MLVYRGPSMYPTFQELDLLRYQRDCPIRAGDVVAFKDPIILRTVVHRVIRVTDNGLVTRGDNSGGIDPYLVPISHVLGVIRSCHRNGVPMRVRGGAVGRAIALGYIVRRHGRRAIRATAGPPYRYLSSRRVISRWTSPLLDLRLSTYLRSDGAEFQIHHHGRIAGICRPGTDRWHLFFPYGILIDVDLLPEPRTGEADGVLSPDGP
jgi:hypothetical protein